MKTAQGEYALIFYSQMLYSSAGTPLISVASVTGFSFLTFLVRLVAGLLIVLYIY